MPSPAYTSISTGAARYTSYVRIRQVPTCMINDSDGLHICMVLTAAAFSRSLGS